MSVEIIEITVKCRVPREDAEEYLLRLRGGEERLPVPAGMICQDAFQCCEDLDPDSTLIRAGYR